MNKINITIFFLISLIVISCAFKKKDTNYESIRILHGGAMSEDFKHSIMYSIIGNTYSQNAVSDITDEDFNYILSIDKKKAPSAFADNILIILTRGDEKIIKKITWGKNNTSLNSIAITLSRYTPEAKNKGLR